jgi:hypothetical protein
MPMPQATVHESDAAVPGKIDVRAAWQILPVETKSHLYGVQDPTDGNFWGGVLPTDRRHVA